MNNLFIYISFIDDDIHNVIYSFTNTYYGARTVSKVVKTVNFSLLLTPSYIGCQSEEPP